MHGVILEVDGHIEQFK